MLNHEQKLTFYNSIPVMQDIE